MRFLAIDEMVCMLPADAKALDAAGSKLSSIFERVKGDASRLTKLTEQGILKTASVNVRGKSVAVFWYRTELERLIVDTLVSVDKDADTLPAATEAMRQVAVANGCKHLEGTTARAGLAQALVGMDWYPVGITIRKDI